MIIPLPYSHETFEKYYRQFGPTPKLAFIEIALVVAKRLFEQTSARPPSDVFLKQMLEISWNVIENEGLPQPLSNKETGEAKAPDYDYYTSLVESVLSQLPRHRSEDSLRILLWQLFIAMLGREFKSCRLSYQELDPQGDCARQSLDNCNDRISGSHCEDCPYFIALSSPQHRKLFTRSWVGDQPVKEEELAVFLPEDFRGLRIFWYLYIRSVN